jgi:PAS domain S-box-containing protein
MDKSPSEAASTNTVVDITNPEIAQEALRKARDLLREKAEAQWQAARDESSDSLGKLTFADNLTLLHDMQVHQIELEMQNEELRQAHDALQVSRARYVDLYDLAPVGYCTVSEKGLLLKANLTLATLLGVTRGELTRPGPFAYFVFRQDQDIWYRLRMLLLESDAPQTAELRMRLSGGADPIDGNGTALWVQLLASISQDNTGQREWHIAVSDISDRKQSEAALAQSEETRWKFAIEGAGYGLWDWNMQTGKAFYSRRYKTMLGFNEDEIGDTAGEWVQRIHPDDAPDVFSAMQPYMDGKPGTATVEFRMLRKDGSWQWTSGRGMVVERDALGTPLRMIGTNTDITERKQFLAQLQAAKDDLQATLDASPDWVFDIGLDGRFHADHSVRPAVLVEPTQAILGMLVSEVMSANAAEVVMAAVQEASATGHTTDKQFTLALPDKQRWFELSAARKPAQANEVPRFIVILRDVSERRLQEKERLDLENRVRDLSRDQVRTAERERILRNMHDGVGSHISSAIRLLQLQLEGGESAVGREILQTMRDAMDQLKLSIDSIHLAPGDVESLLANMRYRIGPRFAALGIDLKWLVEPLPICKGLDAGAMSQLQFILFEALSNVLQHAQSRVLRVEGRVSNIGGGAPLSKGDASPTERVVVRLVDDGCGFESALGSSRGRGLGIMAQRALAIGAQLRINSRPGLTVIEIEIDV